MSSLSSEIVIASHNPGKVREIRELLQPLGVQVLSATEAGVTEEPEETGTTFAENAIIKAEEVMRATGKPCLSDDSGFAVSALHGAPGIYSARWAGADKNFQAAMAKVHQEWERTASQDKTATFHCVLALAMPNQPTQTFAGEISGTICWPPRGKNGFGYDPMFIPDGHHQTFAEMEPAAKHAMNHRARAFAALLQYLRGNTCENARR